MQRIGRIRQHRQRLGRIHLRLSNRMDLAGGGPLRIRAINMRWCTHGSTAALGKTLGANRLTRLLNCQYRPMAVRRGFVFAVKFERGSRAPTPCRTDSGNDNANPITQRISCLFRPTARLPKNDVMLGPIELPQVCPIILLERPVGSPCPLPGILAMTPRAPITYKHSVHFHYALRG